jgi:hypothetical protein
MKHRLSIMPLASAMLTGLALCQSAPLSGGSIQGVVFTTEQDHARSVDPGTKLSPDEDLHLQAEDQREGIPHTAAKSMPAASLVPSQGSGDRRQYARADRAGIEEI